MTGFNLNSFIEIFLILTRMPEYLNFVPPVIRVRVFVLDDNLSSKILSLTIIDIMVVKINF